ncbi:MAG: hypothetical protein NTW65_13395 [Deltaproteobacteria bacterium]|nr:hypothetical protein [Deltaproteobacteria bacterium]
MDVSKKMKDTIIKEIKYAINKIDESATIEDKIYYFSAVQGIFNRVFNIEYDIELVFSYYIFNETFKAFQQKLAAMKMGDTVFVITDQQLNRLSDLTKDFLEQFAAGKSTEGTLKKMVVLLYSTTGNGNYLMGKGLLKI